MSAAKRMHTLILAAVLALSACGGGEEGTGVTAQQAPRDDIVVGTITAFGSIWVNDIHFNVDTSTIVVDGIAGTTSDLRLGMVVTVEGTINPDNETGTARTVSVDEALRGPVSAVTTGSITVLGQTVKIDTATHFDSFSDINQLLGAVVEISGYVQSSGIISATRVERLVEAPIQTKMQGTVENLDINAKTFSIGTLIVNYAQVANVPALANGNVIDIEGVMNEAIGQFDATAITIKTVPVTDAPKFKYQGNVTVAYNSDTREFTVDNLLVRTNKDTRYENLTPAEILVGVRVEVEGALVKGVVQAKEVTLRSTTTATGTATDGN